MRSKILPIILPPSMYRKLELDGRAEERDALQQARWILKRALTDQSVQPSDPRGPGAAA